VDGAPPRWWPSARQAFARLVATVAQRYAEEPCGAAPKPRSGLSDLQFVSAYRVPFQFRALAGAGTEDRVVCAVHQPA